MTNRMHWRVRKVSPAAIGGQCGRYSRIYALSTASAAIRQIKPQASTALSATEFFNVAPPAPRATKHHDLLNRAVRLTSHQAMIFCSSTLDPDEPTLTAACAETAGTSRDRLQVPTRCQAAEAVMSITKTNRPEIPAQRRPAEPAWCVACGFGHDPDTHCPECTGVHQGGYCLTPEAIEELAKHDQLAARIEAAAPRIIDAGDYEGGRS